MRLAVAGLIAGQSMIFGLAASISPPTGQARLVLHGALAVSAVLVFALAGLPILREAWNAARRGRIVIEQLFLAGVVAAFGASVQSTLTGHGHIYYEVVAILVAVYTFGRLVGERRRRAALDAARQLGSEFERAERLTCCGSTESIAASDIREGDRVFVRTGGAIACDGIVVEGTAFVRETALTGEPFPVVKRPGDSVLAGSHTVDGSLTLEASREGTARRLDGLLEAVRSAQDQPSQLQREADRLVAWFLPAVIGVAALTFAFWTWRDGWLTGLFNALAVILVACPCSMGLATPVGIWSALASLASRGIIGKDSNIVERLAKTDVVIFDKTGTLGEEQLERIDFVEASGEKRSELLDAIARLEAGSDHPVARAFRRPGAAAVETRILPAAGIEGRVDGRMLRVGNLNVVPASEVAAAEALARELKGENGASVRIYAVVDGRIAGVALLRERLRDSAREAIARLEELSVRTEVLTGDRAEAAAAHALPNVRAGLTPAEKAQHVCSLRAGGARVLFVGDGVNDAPAMAAAEVALAIGSGSALARESAAAELASGDLAAVPFAIARCREALAAMRWNIRFAAAYNAIGISLAAAGILHPVAAALLMLASSFTVTWKALRHHEPSDAEPRKPFPWRAAWPALGLAAQGPMVAWLGGFHGPTAAGFILLFLAAGAACGLWIWRRPFSPAAEMSVGMFSLGGLAMLIGWWADAGFLPIVRDGVCLCGCASSNMGLGLFGKWNWMDVSMVAASFPAFAAERGTRGRFWCWIVGLAGMLAGMEGAAWLMSFVPVTAASAVFFATYAAMMFGMSIGMVVACEAWRKVRGQA